MKKSVISAAVAGAAGVAVIVSGAAVARTQATRIQVQTAMNAAEEVPAPRGEVASAAGTFAATVTRAATGATIDWRLGFSNLTGRANAAHIHVAPRGQAGPVVVPLCGPCESPATGTATITAEVLDAIESGRAYTNVHTTTNPAGEIRGQLNVLARVTTALNARQEVPRPRGRVARARATFTATVTKSDTNVIAWRLTFGRLTGRAVAAHIHRAARGRPGPVIVSLCGPCRSGQSGRATVSAGVLAALEAGRAYVNVHTARNPAGEVRGQIGAVPLSIS